MYKMDKEIMLNLIEFLRQTLNTDVLDPSFFQIVLIKAIDLIDEAQAGSVTVLSEEDGRYHYAAAVGYDLAELSKVSFSSDEVLFLVKNRKKGSFVVNDLADIHKKNLDKKRASILRNAGKSKKIKATLCLPVRLGSKVVATFMLDNFDDKDAFDIEAKTVAEIMALEIAIAVKQINVVTELRDAKLKLKHEIELMAQEAAIYSRSLSKRIASLELEKFDQKPRFSKRQEQLIGLFAQGKNVAQCATMLDLKRQTVRNYLSGVYKILGLKSRKEVIAWAKENGY